MTDETTITNPDFDPTLPPNAGDIVAVNDNEYVIEDVEFKSSPEAQAAAAEALEVIADRSFSGRNAVLGKMINCQVCLRRHRRNDVAYREHYDKEGNKTVTLEPLIADCKQQFKQLWVDEDLETGELSIQYAMVPLPGQGHPTKGFKNPARPIVGAAQFAKKRKKRHPNKTGLQIIELTRQIFPFVISENFKEEAGRMLEARRLAVNTLRNRRERESKRIRQQQRESRRINRTR
jgi:hypothetical protein